MSPGLHQPLLIQVLARLMPGRCGVSDQAVFLASELKNAFGIDSAFVVLNSNEQCTLPYATIYCPPAKLLESGLDLTHERSGAMLLHVSGYGYSPDGAPTLLADALQKVRASGRFRTAAYIHETFASGPPWKSAFWHAHRQKRAVRRIVAQSDLVVTNMELHAEWLRRESEKLGGVPIERMPVISPAGETDQPVPFSQRDAALVVFGRGGTREWAYQKLAKAGNLLSKLEIARILDIGPDWNCPPQVSGIPVKQMGVLPSEDLPTIFSMARFGFVPHPWFCLAKSSIFAAYCAQGTIPVLADPFPKEVDGLRPGVHVVTPETVEAVRNSGWDVCSCVAWKWYMQHRLQFHAELYAKWMGNGH